MALTSAEYEKIRKELSTAEKPLIFFHDDADGLSSFLLLYRFMGKGKGVMIKPVPVIGTDYLRYVEEYGPDKIFIVDIAVVEQEFLDGVSIPVIWIDHHQLLERNNVQYFNPRAEKQEDNEPATALCYKAVKQDLWIAMVGSIGDWHIPDFAARFSKDHPDLLPPEIKKPQDALFGTPVGTLVRIFSFALKGPHEEAMKNVKILTRMTSPQELLEQKTPAARHVYRYYSKYQEKYDRLLKKADAAPSEDSFTVFLYEATHSFTGEISNEMLYKRPDDVILIGREKGDEVRISFRGSGKNVILPRLQKALEGVEGRGGGHEYACGGSVKKKDFKKFLAAFKKEFS